MAGGEGAKQGLCLLPGLAATAGNPTWLRSAVGCRGVPQACLVQRAQCSPAVTALLAHRGQGWLSPAGMSPGGDRRRAKATWILCPPRVQSGTQPPSQQDLCRAGEVRFPPLLPFPLPSNLGRGWAGGPADGAPLHGGLVTPTPPPRPPWVASVSVTTGRWWLSPSPVSPHGPMAMLCVAAGWFGAAKSSWGAGPYCPTSLSQPWTPFAATLELYMAENKSHEPRGCSQWPLVAAGLSPTREEDV